MIGKRLRLDSAADFIAGRQAKGVDGSRRQQQDAILR